MNKTTLVFLGIITYTQAIRLPDYWDGEYSNTWFYAGRDHIVNAAEWKESDPCGYSDAVWGTAAEECKVLNNPPSPPLVINAI